jgi:hypothetical protein
MILARRVNVAEVDCVGHGLNFGIEGRISACCSFLTRVKTDLLVSPTKPIPD